MICELGNFLILTSMIMSLLEFSFSFFSKIVTSRARLLSFLSVTIAYIFLLYAFITQNTSVLGVILYSSSDYSLIYKISSTWTYHQGSLLVWCFMMGTVALFLPHQASKLFSILKLYFLGFLYFKATPFLEISDGNLIPRGLNPLLEDSGLLYHPPLLYLGYILTLATYCSLNSLKHARVLSLSAWCSLGLGLLSGSFWAFHEVGWGGWWFWDPVENIAFIPWLLLLGMIHNFKNNDYSKIALLSFLSFSWVFIGVFIVRMGLIRSIHNFAQSSENYLFLYLGIGVVLFSGFTFFKNHPLNFKPFKRLDIPFLLGILFSSLIGFATLFPLFSSQEFSEEFYLQIVSPLLLLYVALLLLFWMEKDKRLHIKHMGLILIVGLCGSMFIQYAFHKNLHFVFMSFGFALMFGILVFQNYDFKKLPSILSHGGIMIMLLGIVFNNSLTYEKDFNLNPQDEFTFLNQKIKFASIESQETPVFKSQKLLLESEKFKLKPEQRFYPKYNLTKMKVDYDLGLFETFYVYILDHKDHWSIHFQYHPLISWIWLGMLLVVFGGLLSLWLRIRTNITNPQRINGV